MALKLKRDTRAHVEAYVAATDLRRFDLLIEDLKSALDENWEEIDVDGGLEAFAKDPFEELEVLVVAVDRADEDNMGPIAALINRGKSLGLKVLLVAHELSPVGLHQLMRHGADDFAPYPLPENALPESLERLRRGPTVVGDSSETGPRDRQGMILPIYGAAGGVGASTFAVNLAWEMALYGKKTNKRICLLDLDFQYGSVATYLDLPRRESIYELVTDAENIDHDALASALTSYKSRLAVLTSPLDALPLDITSPAGVEQILTTAQSSYDFVIVDLPTTLVAWSETVLRLAETYFAVLETDMRSAQNMVRFLRTLKAEDLPVEKIQYALNRAPGFTDLSGKSRIKRMADTLGIAVNIMLPDGGKAVANAGDQGMPLAESAAKNPLRKEVRRIATSLVDMAADQKAAIA